MVLFIAGFGEFACFPGFWFGFGCVVVAMQFVLVWIVLLVNCVSLGFDCLLVRLVLCVMRFTVVWVV